MSNGDAKPSAPQDRAKRLDRGEYAYRGFKITDHGAGGSAHARMARYSGRWGLVPFTPGDLPRLRFTDAPTLREAKREIDSAYRKKEVANV